MRATSAPCIVRIPGWTTGPEGGTVKIDYFIFRTRTHPLSGIWIDPVKACKNLGTNFKNRFWEPFSVSVREAVLEQASDRVIEFGFRVSTSKTCARFVVGVLTRSCCSEVERVRF